MKARQEIADLQQECDLAARLIGRLGDDCERLDSQLAEARKENERLRQFAEWVAGHQLVQGSHADDEHPYTEWITPDHEEMDFGDVHDYAREVLGLPEGQSE